VSHPISRTLEEWTTALAEIGERPYRAKQVFRWIHVKGELDPQNMTDLPASLREKLAIDPATLPRVVEVHRSADHTRKLVLELEGGARVECVLIRMTRLDDADVAAGDDDEDAPEGGLDEEPVPKDRVTLCISTQFGCAMGCVFCASGQSGLMRGLLAHEIVAQVLLSKRYLDPSEHLRNIVYMGMGEPLHHYAETERSLRLLMHPEGLHIGPRRITVSTVGLIPGLARLGEDFGGKIGLAVSLHAPDDETRDRIVPMNKRFPLDELLAALRRYPLPKRRRITIEYTLIDGINDSVAHAQRLVRVLGRLPVKVNLIPMNSIAASSFHAPKRERVQAFKETLARAGIATFLRTRRGDDVSAACGQLALAENLTKKPGQRLNKIQ
jgi:23S rRNA (adenine2503-C2)-methyltransferase